MVSDFLMSYDVGLYQGESFDGSQVKIRRRRHIRGMTYTTTAVDS